MNRRSHLALSVLALAGAFAGCGGGGGSHGPLPTTGGGASSSTAARFTMKIPAKRAASGSRSTRYLSPDSQGLVVNVVSQSGALPPTPTFVGSLSDPTACSTDASGNRTCTFVLGSIPVGSVTFDVGVYNVAPVNGVLPSGATLLSHVRALQTVQVNATNSLTFSLGGDVASVKAAFGVWAAASTQGTYTLPVTLTMFDAMGDPIVEPVSPQTPLDTPITLTLPSNGSVAFSGPSPAYQLTLTTLPAGPVQLLAAGSAPPVNLTVANGSTTVATLGVPATLGDLVIGDMNLAALNGLIPGAVLMAASSTVNEPYYAPMCNPATSLSPVVVAAGPDGSVAIAYGYPTPVPTPSPSPSSSSSSSPSPSPSASSSSSPTPTPSPTSTPTPVTLVVNESSSGTYALNKYNVATDLASVIGLAADTSGNTQMIGGAGFYVAGINGGSPVLERWAPSNVNGLPQLTSTWGATSPTLPTGTTGIAVSGTNLFVVNALGGNSGQLQSGTLPTSVPASQAAAVSPLVPIPGTPTAVAVSQDGQKIAVAYVPASGPWKITYYNPAGAIFATISISPGTGAANLPNAPGALTFDHFGNLWVTDGIAHLLGFPPLSTTIAAGANTPITPTPVASFLVRGGAAKMTGIASPFAAFPFATTPSTFIPGSSPCV